jgi:hypothetical protein
MFHVSIFNINGGFRRCSKFQIRGIAKLYRMTSTQLNYLNVIPQRQGK